MNGWIEYGLIGLIVALSAWTVFGRLFPGLRRRLLQAFGRSAPATSAGCDSGCSSCDGCAPKQPGAGSSGEQPIHFQRGGSH